MRERVVTSSHSRAGNVWLGLPVVVLAVTVLAVLFHVAVSLEFPYEIGYGESPILDQISRLARLDNIYTSSLAHPPYTVSNYPPVFHLTLLPFFSVFGPAYWYGRLISTISILAVAVLLFLTLDVLTRSRRASFLGSLTFLVIPPVIRWAPLARVDFLALALSWLGLYLVVRRPPTRLILVVAGLCFVASSYTKQSYVLVAPLTAVVWLVAQHRVRQGVLLLLGSIAVIAGIFGILNLMTSGGFALHTLAANQNAFSWVRAGAFYTRLWQQMPLLLMGAIAFPLLAGRRHELPLAGPYVAGSLAVGLAIGKIGSDWNYFLELAAAMGLAAGLWAARLGTSGWRPRLFALGLSLQVAWGCWIMNQEIMAPRRQLLLGERGQWETLRRIVRQAPGPILTDSGMGFLPLEGEPIYFQCFEMTQLAREGKWNETPVIRSVERKAFPLIVLNLTPAVLAERWTPRMLEAIAANYDPVERVRLGKRMDGVFRPHTARSVVPAPRGEGGASKGPLRSAARYE